MSDSPVSHEREPLGDLAGLGETAWGSWPQPTVIDSTPSTMLEVERRAAEGAPEGCTVVAEEQTAGRGRRGRSWESPPRAGLWWSVLLRPEVPIERLGWLPLVVGVGVVRALRAAGGVEAMLKWPNDLVVGVESPLKLGGILAERLADGAVIVGVGINVDQRGDEMPEGATSLRACGATGTREELLKSILASVAGTYRSWCAGADLSDEYAAMSATLGSIVDADIGDRVLRGRAVALGPAGELLVETADGGRESVSAGDVTRVRPAH